MRTCPTCGALYLTNEAFCPDCLEYDNYRQHQTGLQLIDLGKIPRPLLRMAKCPGKWCESCTPVKLMPAGLLANPNENQYCTNVARILEKYCGDQK